MLRFIPRILAVLSVLLVFWRIGAGAASTLNSGASVLTQTLNAVGGTTALSAIQDFTASGTITYFWAGNQVMGSATVRGRGLNQFRLDAALPGGTRSFAVSYEKGALKDMDGKLTLIPYHDTINVGLLTFPFPDIAARLNEPTTVISDMGMVAADSGQLHQVRVQRQFSTSIDPDGTISILTITDYFIDPATNFLMRVQDATHPVETMTQNYSHEIDFGNYTNVKGITVPMFVREKISGQTIWELQLTGISFNTGLTDSDFVLQ